jgi:hypothetical protein
MKYKNPFNSKSQAGLYQGDVSMIEWQNGKMARWQYKW